MEYSIQIIVSNSILEILRIFSTHHHIGRLNGDMNVHVKYSELRSLYAVGTIAIHCTLTCNAMPVAD